MKDAVQEQLADARRTQILEAAARVFAEKGFHSATIRDIARQAGIADGTIYNYFENKTALLLGIFGLMTDTARAQVDPAEIARLELRDFIRLFLERPLVAFKADNFELFRVIVSEVMTNAELRGLFHERVLGPMLSAGEGYFAQRAAGRGSSPERVQLQVRAASSLILGLLLQRIIGDEVLEAEWDALPGLVADLLVDGLEGERP